MWQMNNYSVAPLLMVVAIVTVALRYKREPHQKWFLIGAPVLMLLGFTAVFLVTENYKFVLDQTTVNRVFTMSIVVFFSYVGVLIYDKK